MLAQREKKQCIRTAGSTVTRRKSRAQQSVNSVISKGLIIEDLKKTEVKSQKVKI